MSYQQPPYPAPTPPKKKRAPLVLVIVFAGLALCVGGTVIAGLLSDNSDDKAAAAVTSAPAAGGNQKAGAAQGQAVGEPGAGCATSQLGKHIVKDGQQYTCGGPKPYRWLPDHTSAPAGGKPTIKGDDLVHVGEDVPAGTYRAADAVGADCYWKKSRDAEGDDIIDNDIPGAGRPQVTLKAGQWFVTKHCADWVKR